MQKDDADSSKINSASLIDLKAELFRKQEEYRAQKLSSQHDGYIKGKPSSSNKKPTIWNKKNKGVTDRAEKDYEEKVEEDNVFERSKKSLENKAKLYDKIASSSEVPDEDGSNFFLVDFQKKVIDDKQERKRNERLEAKERQEQEEERLLSEQPIPQPTSSNEEWVDYTDCLGRSRRCLREDLPSLQQRDKEFYTAKIVPKEKAAKDFEKLRDKSDERDLMSKDMVRENERQKWEKEEEEKMTAEKEGPIHYGDVLHNETRTHGVAFYKFDTNEETRKEQMDELLKLRQETKDERSKSDRIKAKRKAALAARLSKVKQRKREKLGLPEEDEKEESEEEIGPKLAEAEKEPELLTRDDEWRKNVKSKRAWDKGKESIPERSEQAWLDTQRKERFDEFAPPTFYYTDNTSKQQQGESKTLNTLFDSEGKKVQTSVKSDPDDKMDEIVGEQLSQMRTEYEQNTEHIDKESSKPRPSPYSASFTSSIGLCLSDNGHHYGRATSQNVPNPQSFNIPPPPSLVNNYPPISVPPPPMGGYAPPPFPVNMQAPPPVAAQMPVPPTFQVSAPPPPPPFPVDMSAPPPFTVDMSHPPPPAMPGPPIVDVSMPPPSWNTNSQPSVRDSHCVYGSVAPPTTSDNLTSAVTMSETKPKFVPRMNVLDTRFMENDDAD